MFSRRSSSGGTKGASGSIRPAAHSGSWYQSSSSKLANSIDGFLSTPPNISHQEKQQQQQGNAQGVAKLPQAIISPHAGYSYSGPTAGSAFHAGLSARLSSSKPVSTIYVIHPSHKIYLRGVGITCADTIATPITNLAVDTEELKAVTEDLRSAGVDIRPLTLEEDGDEHSGEMQYPIIARVLQKHGIVDARIVPIMVGATDAATSLAIGRALSPRILSPTSFTVVSSDFCHWGPRFDYTPFREKGDAKRLLDPPSGNYTIGELITILDRRGMTEIESLKPGGFVDYLRRTGNTICGRHPIEVLLFAVDADESSRDAELSFIRYEKSEEVVHASDNSVSYASGVMFY